MANQHGIPEGPGEQEGRAASPVQVRVALKPADGSEQPVFSNFTAAQGGAGTVFLDFGFLEPQAIRTIAQRARSREVVSDAVAGRLVCRVALTPETAGSLMQQLNQVLGLAVQPRPQRVAVPDPSNNSPGAASS